MSNNLLTQDLDKLSSTQLSQLYIKLRLPPSSSIISLKDFSDVVSKPIILQLVDVVNVSRSKINQLDDMLGIMNPNDLRTDQMRNKKKNPNQSNASRNRLIRDIDMENDSHSNSVQPLPSGGSNNDYYKVTLMDYKGNLVYGIELTKLGFLSNSSIADNLKGGFLPVALGSKIVVKPGTKIMLDVLMLKNELTVYAGGFSTNPVGLEKVVIENLKLSLDSLQSA
ncbi:Rmi1 protein [Saccharomycopsis crataegensis]|uniref:Rmi1 protein n=1 Tax=Saccharomycopsis crataegensis TaxID=43959 RepID=A0AAV5QK90_9ASCO|nr:Rmi1 protein [Saccharomycopsis crataegensis]